jgi:hypothetical protein
MTIATATLEQLLDLDRKLVQTLGQRKKLLEESREREEGLDLPEAQVEIAAVWAEEGEELGLDEIALDKIAKGVAELCRPEEE